MQKESSLVCTPCLNFYNDSCFLQIWRDRPLYRGVYQNREGFWGDVDYEEDNTEHLYLGATPEEIIRRMKIVVMIFFADLA